MTTLPEPIGIALRAWALPDARRRAGSNKRRRHRPEALVVFDTETELGGAQRLLVGSFRYVRVEWRGSVPVLRCAEEGLFYPDDLEERDPEQLVAICGYARTRSPDVDPARDHGSCTQSIIEYVQPARPSMAGFA